jgi:hypothetical protein
MTGMILASMLLAAMATGMSLVGLIDGHMRHAARPAKTRKAPARPLIKGSTTPNLVSAKTTTWARVPGTPDMFEPRRLSGGEFGTSKSPAEQVGTAGALYRVRNNVPGSRVSDRWFTSRFGVDRRTGVGTHRASRVPIRKAQPVRRRGVATGWLPHPQKAVPALERHGGPDAREPSTYPALARQ